MRAAIGLLLLVGCGSDAALDRTLATVVEVRGEATVSEDAVARLGRAAADQELAVSGLARLEMDAGAAVPEHADADEEYIVVLEGRGVITIDGVQTEIGPGSTVFMPAGATVSYQNGDAPMIALQIFAGPASAAKYERWTPIEE